MTKHKPDIRFTISTERDNWSSSMDYSLKLHTVVMGARDDEIGKVLNPGHFYLDNPNYSTNPLDGLCITALHSQGDDTGYWFGWEVRYNQPYAVDEKRAAEMLKTLRAVRRKLEKFERELGRAESLEAYAMRVARALGATTDRPFGFRDASSYDGTGYRWHDAEGLRYVLDRTVKGEIEPTYKGGYY